MSDSLQRGCQRGEFREDFRDSLERDSDDVRRAADNPRHEWIAQLEVFQGLEPVGAALALPIAAVEVRGQFRLGPGAHGDAGRDDAGQGEVLVAAEQAPTSEDLVFLVGNLAEHAFGVGPVDRLLQHFAFGMADGVAGEDQAASTLANGGPPLHEGQRGQAREEVAEVQGFRLRYAGGVDGDPIPGPLQQGTTMGGLAGEDDGMGHGIGVGKADRERSAS
jgi:hypothetical protein